ncbi:MAG: nickel transport protein [Desulfobacteraceae bacterium Eth-SRB1]|nr:MAG: nickel transport protein [Desulfobacteraceae bacterium Eth-SRB1]
MHRLNLCKKYTRISKVIAFFLLTVLYLTMTAPWVLAHKVLLTAYVEGDTVFVEGGFSDGTSCKNAGIEVFDPSGKKLLEGKTNENGEFSFKPPQKTDLKLVLNAGMGHRGEYTVPADELQGVVVSNQATTTEAMSAPTVETRKTQGISEAIAQIDLKEIESIVDRVIQKRLRPLAKLVAESQRKTGFSPTEIFGGIGYIFGLMGVAMYFRYRKGSKF